MFLFGVCAGHRYLHLICSLFQGYAWPEVMKTLSSAATLDDFRVTGRHHGNGRGGVRMLLMSSKSEQLVLGDQQVANISQLKTMFPIEFFHRVGFVCGQPEASLVMLKEFGTQGLAES